MTFLVTSGRTLFQTAVFLLILFAVGVTQGLELEGPFDYLDAQLTIHDAMQTIQTETIPGLPDSLESFFTVIVELGTYLSMRGITYGYNAPTWVTVEFVYACAFFAFAAAAIVFLRAWRYTTTVPLK